MQADFLNPILHSDVTVLHSDVTGLLKTPRYFFCEIFAFWKLKLQEEHIENSL